LTKKKFYAVKCGRKIGLFDTWSKCKAQVDGFPGAVFKSFPTEKEATAWLNGNSGCETAKPSNGSPISTVAEKTPPVSAELFPAEKSFAVYTDGSCLKNPDGPGGWAAVIIGADGEVKELFGGEPKTTNNRMELTAAIEALSYVPADAEINLYTDSQYLKNAFTQNWLGNWLRNGWRTATGGEVKNKDLWVRLYAEYSRRYVKFNWVKGHAGDKHNERCDELAKQEALRQ